MAAVINRWIWQNFVQLSNTNIFASSEEINFPKLWLRDPLRSKRWRSKMGWIIVAGFNDTFVITEGVTGNATVTLTAGHYATGDLMAAEVQTQINAAATDNAWTCTYDSATNKFTIGHDNTQTGGILWTNALSIAGLDLGYDVSADDTGGVSYVADNVAYQSRHFIKFDLVSSLELKAAIIFDSNILSTAVVTVQGNATDSWGSPTMNTVMAFGNNLFAKQFAGTSLRWWRFVIDDVQNPDGFSQVGVPYLGSYTQMTLGFHFRHQNDRSELSQISTADQGSHYQNLRPTRRMWPVRWPGMPDVDKINLETILAFVRVGRAFFFALDAADETNVVYVMFREGSSFDSIGASQWDAPFELSEVI